MSSPILDLLTEEVRADIGAMDSAATFISGFGARMQAAIDAALAGGATAAQLDQLSGLAGELLEKREAIAAAIAANP